MSTENKPDDDGYTMIPVHVRLYADGRFVVADGDEMDDDPSSLDDRATYFDDAGPFREFIVNVRAKRPALPAVEVSVDVHAPDEPPHEPATASAA